jgi:hypothetical protein
MHSNSPRNRNWMQNNRYEFSADQQNVGSTTKGPQCIQILHVIETGCRTIAIVLIFHKKCENKALIDMKLFSFVK